jgi:hypothetical protein
MCDSWEIINDDISIQKQNEENILVSQSKNTESQYENKINSKINSLFQIMSNTKTQISIAIILFGYIFVPTIKNSIKKNTKKTFYNIKNIMFSGLFGYSIFFLIHKI